MLKAVKSPTREDESMLNVGGRRMEEKSMLNVGGKRVEQESMM